MKLKFERKTGFDVLLVNEEISDPEFQVLRAGIQKLLKDGKNKIAIHLLEASVLSSSHVRELIFTNVLARELNGEICLIVENPNLFPKVSSFANPRAIGVFKDLESAGSHLLPSKKTGSSAEQSGSKIATASGSVELLAELEKKNSEIKELKESLKGKEGGELQAVKAENSQLKSRLTKLEEKLLSLDIERRIPKDEKTYSEKIVYLEGQVEELVQKLQSAASPAKA